MFDAHAGLSGRSRGAEMHGDQLVPMGAVGRFPRWFTHSCCSRSPKDAAGCEQPQALGSISMDCVEELAKSPVAKISTSRAEPDLRGPVAARRTNGLSLRIPSLAGSQRECLLRVQSTHCGSDASRTHLQRADARPGCE